MRRCDAVSLSGRSTGLYAPVQHSVGGRETLRREIDSVELSWQKGVAAKSLKRRLSLGLRVRVGMSGMRGSGGGWLLQCPVREGKGRTREGLWFQWGVAGRKGKWEWVECRGRDAHREKSGNRGTVQESAADEGLIDINGEPGRVAIKNADAFF